MTSRYDRMTMTLMRRTLATAVAACLVLSGCGSDSENADDNPVGDSEQIDVVDDVTSPTTTAPRTTAAEAADVAVSLGEREAGYGPGSLAIAAGEYFLRLTDLDGSAGAWFPTAYTFEPRPEVCGYATAEAVQGQTLSRQNPAEAPFGDGISIEVHVLGDQASAQAEVAKLNGDAAVECDVAAKQRAEAQFQEEVADVMNIDLGDGIGQPAAPFADVPANAVREFVASISVGSQQRALDQIESFVADGRFLIHTTVVSSTGSAAAIHDELNTLLFAGEPPTIDPDPAESAALDRLRSAVVDADELPDFYDENDAATYFRQVADPTSCYKDIPDIGVLAGPSWVAISPGVGGSQVQQSSFVLADEDEAAEVFTLFETLGAECYNTVTGLADPPFTLIESSLERLEVDGFDVLLVTLDYIQMLGTQEFDAQAGIAVTTTGRYILNMEFAGLTGDSPDLANLVVSAAKHLQP